MLRIDHRRYSTTSLDCVMANPLSPELSRRNRMIALSLNLPWAFIGTKKATWHINHLSCRLVSSPVMRSVALSITLIFNLPWTDTGKTFLYSRLDLPGPEELLSTEEYCQEILQDKRLTAQLKVNATQELQMLPGIDFRFCQPRNPVNPQPRWPARRYVWVKTNEPLPDDPQMHQSAIVYCSDRILLPTAYLPYALIGADSRIKLQTSLDYAVWFHDGFNYDQNDQSNPSEPDPTGRRSTTSPEGGTRPCRRLVTLRNWVSSADEPSSVGLCSYLESAWPAGCHVYSGRADS